MASWMSSATPTIVVVTDRKLREPMRTFLSQLDRSGHQIHIVPRITYEHTRQISTPQVVLVDVVSRAFDVGAGITTSIRATWEYVAIVLVASMDEIARVQFSAEFHGFLTLPVQYGELEARIRFAQWKTQGAQPPRDLLEVGSLRMDLATYEVWVGENKVEFTFKEFELLKFFITHQRRVFSRADLLDSVWESDYYGETRTVDVHVRRLRAKLGPQVGNMIHTVRNVGYRFG